MLLLEIANKTDYTILRKQRDLLVYLPDNQNISEGARESIDGVVAFIDNFLDAIVEEGIKTEQEVFGASSKD